MAGVSGAGPITKFDASDFAVQMAHEVHDFDANDWMERKDARRFDPFVAYAVACALQALEQARLSINPGNADRVGVLIGTGLGGFHAIQAGFETLLDKGPMRVNPLTGAMMLPDMAAGQIAIMTGARGPNFAIISACATGSHVIGEAGEIIRRGDADVMIAGATEAVMTPFGLAAFHRTGAMSTRNEDPKRASRPFDARRDGFVVGEGAGALVLERLEHAVERGTRPLAELVGYGATADAYHVSAPLEDGSGAAKAMQAALSRAGLDARDIGYINAHGTGTPLNDVSETLAIKQVFGEYAPHVPISSTKSMVGHCMGAAGAVEAVVTVEALQSGMLPPTINYEYPDPECDLDYVPNEPREANVRFALSNSFGFGGHNASLIFGAWNGRPKGGP
jgi:3-oxoacyl-[acyl-carrier-protein] synthase II